MRKINLLSMWSNTIYAWSINKFVYDIATNNLQDLSFFRGVKNYNLEDLIENTSYNTNRLHFFSYLFLFVIFKHSQITLCAVDLSLWKIINNAFEEWAH